MYKVEFKEEGYNWANYIFEFETLEEAYEFVKQALTHRKKKSDDEGELVIDVSYKQHFTTGKEDE